VIGGALFPSIAVCKAEGEMGRERVL